MLIDKIQMKRVDTPPLKRIVLSDGVPINKSKCLSKKVVFGEITMLNGSHFSLEKELGKIF